MIRRQLSDRFYPATTMHVSNEAVLTAASSKCTRDLPELTSCPAFTWQHNMHCCCVPTYALTTWGCTTVKHATPTHLHTNIMKPTPHIKTSPTRPAYMYTCTYVYTHTLIRNIYRLSQCTVITSFKEVDTSYVLIGYISSSRCHRVWTTWGCITVQNANLLVQ